MWPFSNQQKNNQHHQRSDSKKNFNKPSIVIKIAVSQWKRAHSWGDYHMAVLLKEQLEIEGHRVLIQVSSEWQNNEGLGYDVVIVFRGLKRYKLNTKQLNIMWNISHPDDVSIEEYEEYDKVFIASSYWTKKISSKVSSPVDCMWQCTDPKRFTPIPEDEKKNYHHQLLFVGNSRGLFRKIIKDLLPTQYNLAIYGQGWEGLIPQTLIKGHYISNDVLSRYYSSADILLNDHWDDMREKGFISNRIFDGLACDAFIITDRVRGMNAFEEYITVYETKKQLQELLALNLVQNDKKEIQSKKGRQFILNRHTFNARAKVFSSTITKRL